MIDQVQRTIAIAIFIKRFGGNYVAVFVATGQRQRAIKLAIVVTVFAERRCATTTGTCHQAFCRQRSIALLGGINDGDAFGRDNRRCARDIVFANQRYAH